ncbi:hypothetical protein NDN08_008203 [Rhodosorus marinus]|uniref:Transmembrane protein 188 n=1 Tax=Rhodosorus marinus TaxID=101924 RepID=A0AAV8V3K8_9RHOD|nr:hypothetical protein NDN08_008203 [Rhodosorus marinus]
MNVGIDAQLGDLRHFERNVRTNVHELRRTRGKFVALFTVLLVLSVCSFVELATGMKSSQNPAIWISAWFSLGILPLSLFFSFGLQVNLTAPETYVRRMNTALAPFYIAYDGQAEKLFRVDQRPQEIVDSSLE